MSFLAFVALFTVLFVNVPLGIWGPHLVVVPTSVMLNWEMEFKKWCPSFKILTYYGSQKDRKQKRTGIRLVELLVSSSSCSLVIFLQDGRSRMLSMCALRLTSWSSRIIRLSGASVGGTLFSMKRRTSRTSNLKDGNFFSTFSRKGMFLMVSFTLAPTFPF